MKTLKVHTKDIAYTLYWSGVWPSINAKVDWPWFIRKSVQSDFGVWINSSTDSLGHIVKGSFIPISAIEEFEIED
jgi:hypothetical protein